MRNLLSAVLLATAVPFAAHATVPMIVDGSFEDITATPGFITDITGQTVGGWNTGARNKEYIVNGNARIASGQSLGTTPFGSQYVALANRSLGGAPISANISQTISGLTVGAVYEISAYAAALTRAGTGGSGGIVNALGIGLQDVLGTDVAFQSFGFTGAGPFGFDVIPFEQKTLRFTAVADTETLFLSNQSFSSVLGIDNVSLRQVGTGGSGAVPEPTTWMTMIGGMALVGAGMRRRRARARIAAA